MFPTKEQIPTQGINSAKLNANYSDFQDAGVLYRPGFTDNNLELKRLWSTGVFQKLAGYVLTVAVQRTPKRGV